MGDIREINPAYRIDPLKQPTIPVSRKQSDGQSPKHQRNQEPHDEIVLTHHEEGFTEPEVSASVPPDKESPGLDISA